MNLSKYAATLLLGTSLLFTTGCNLDDVGDDLSDAGDGIEQTLSSIVSGIVNLSTTSTSASANRLVRANTTPEETVASAKVQLYAVDDSEYKTPLLTTAVVVAADGSYNVKKTDFADQSLGIDGDFIIRTIVESADGTNYDLSAIKKKGDSTDVVVNPVSTYIKETLMSFISTQIAGVEFTTEIVAAIDAMSTAITLQVTAGSATVALTSFDAPDINVADFNGNEASAVDADKIALDAQQNKDIAATITINENKIQEKATADLATVTSTDFAKAKDDNITVATQAEYDTFIGIARAKYGLVKSLTSIGLTVHDGNNKAIALMHVDSKELTKLPGKAYQITVNFGSETTIIDGDPGLRLIDIKTDLAQASGTDEWVQDFAENADMPVVPQQFLIEMLSAQRDNSGILLSDFGAFFTNYQAPFGCHEFSTGALACTNPFTILAGVATSTDPEATTDAIIGKFQANIIKSQLTFRFQEIVNQARWEGHLQEFLDIFTVATGDTEDAFIARYAASRYYQEDAQEMRQMLLNSIPYSSEDSAILSYTAGTISPTTKITPKTAIALLAVVMESLETPNAELFQAALACDSGGDGSACAQQSEISGFTGYSDADLESAELNASALGSTQVWAGRFTAAILATFDQAFDKSTLTALPCLDTNTCLGTANDFNSDNFLQSALGVILNNTNVRAESTYKAFSTTFKEVLEGFKKKAEQGEEFLHFDADAFTADFGDANSTDLAIAFKVGSYDSTNNYVDANLSSIQASPVLMRVATGEWIFENSSVTPIIIDSTAKVGSEWQTTITLAKPGVRVAADGTLNATGEYELTGFWQFKAKAEANATSYDIFLGERPFGPHDTQVFDMFFDANDKFFGTGDVQFEESHVNFLQLSEDGTVAIEHEGTELTLFNYAAAANEFTANADLNITVRRLASDYNEQDSNQIWDKVFNGTSFDTYDEVTTAIALEEEVGTFSAATGKYWAGAMFQVTVEHNATHSTKYLMVVSHVQTNYDTQAIEFVEVSIEKFPDFSSYLEFDFSMTPEQQQALNFAFGPDGGIFGAGGDVNFTSQYTVVFPNMTLMSTDGGFNYAGTYTDVNNTCDVNVGFMDMFDSNNSYASPGHMDFNFTAGDNAGVTMSIEYGELIINVPTQEEFRMPFNLDGGGDDMPPMDDSTGGGELDLSQLSPAAVELSTLVQASIGGQPDMSIPGTATFYTEGDVTLAPTAVLTSTDGGMTFTGDSVDGALSIVFTMGVTGPDSLVATEKATSNTLEYVFENGAYIGMNITIGGVVESTLPAL